MFWKKKKPATDKIILGMVLLRDAVPFNTDKLIADLKANYGHETIEPEGEHGIMLLSIGAFKVAVAFMPAPVPAGDIEAAAQYAFTWPTAADELRDHSAHIIVSVLKGGPDPVSRFRLFTQVICALLRQTNAIGVYKGNQSLLIPSSEYLNDGALMSEDHLPVNLWVYIGLRSYEGANHGYTYGLVEFGKKELEVVGSRRDLGDIGDFLLNIAHYVLLSDVEFKDGETCGATEEEIITISYSRGKLVPEKSFKLAY